MSGGDDAGAAPASASVGTAPASAPASAAEAPSDGRFAQAAGGRPAKSAIDANPGAGAGAAGQDAAASAASPGVTPEPWQALRRHTPARIALGRAGVSLPTAALLAFQRAHAEARDAVHRPFDAAGVEAALADALGLPAIRLHSAAPDRATYLKRPDLGRRLDAASEAALAALAAPERQPDIALVVADGLSTRAAESHAAALARALQAALGTGWHWAPVAVVEQARVAIGDPIGHALGARLVVVAIGERPGLSSPDSLGLYVTWGPRPGRTDAERNCISNVRPEGLAPDAAAARLAWLLNEARRRRLTGVGLKDDSEPAVPALDVRDSFLLGG